MKNNPGRRQQVSVGDKQKEGMISLGSVWIQAAFLGMEEFVLKWQNWKR